MLSFFSLVPRWHALDNPNGVLGMLFYSFSFLWHLVGKPAEGLSSLFSSPANAAVSSLAIAPSAFLGKKWYVTGELCSDEGGVLQF